MEAIFYSQIRRFYEANRQDLYAYALSLARSREAAEDAVQSAIVRLLCRERLPTNPRPYAYRCVRNAVVDGFRELGPSGDPLLDLDGDQETTEDPSRLRLVEQCLERLTNDERETVVLKAFIGLTFREVAAVRRRTTGTVASWYRRGLEKMRRMLEEDT